MKRGKRFIPTEKVLQHAWQLKLNGFTDAEIAAKIGVSTVTYSLHRLRFLVFFAQRRRELDRIQRAGRPPGPAKLDRFRLAAVKLAEIGENIEQIAKQLGIPDNTLRAWMKEDETFGHEMTIAKDRADQLVIRSLLRRALGYTTREATKTDMRIGNAIAQSTTTRRVSHVLPSVKAIELWLTNRRKWLSENQADASTLADDRAIEYEIVDKLFNVEKKSDASK